MTAQSRWSPAGRGVQRPGRWAWSAATISLLALLLVSAVQWHPVRPTSEPTARDTALAAGMIAALGSVWVGAVLHGRRAIAALFLLGYPIFAVGFAAGSGTWRSLGFGIVAVALLWNAVALRQPCR